MKDKPEPKPAERRETLRQGMMRELAEEELTALQLSQRLGLRERDVVAHLEHLRRSLGHAGQRLAITAAECRDCGFAFRKRERLGRPSACPQCRKGRIEPPRFRVVPA